jgi:hypothetical protein
LSSGSTVANIRVIAVTPAASTTCSGEIFALPSCNACAPLLATVCYKHIIAFSIAKM